MDAVSFTGGMANKALNVCVVRDVNKIDGDGLRCYEHWLAQPVEVL